MSLSVSVVIPVYNEEENVPLMYDALNRVTSATDAFGDRRNNLDLAAGTRVARFTAVAQANIVEHGLLSRRLRLFVASEDGEDQRLAGESVNMARVQLGAEEDEHVAIYFKAMELHGRIECLD